MALAEDVKQEEPKKGSFFEQMSKDGEKPEEPKKDKEKENVEDKSEVEEKPKLKEEKEDKKQIEEVKDKEVEEDDLGDPSVVYSIILDGIKEDIGEVEIPEEILKGEITPESLIKFSKIIAETAGKRELEVFASNYPEAYDLAYFIDNGGKIEEFLQLYKGTDYTKIELNEDNPEQLKNIIRTAYEEAGLAKRKIEKLIADSEDEGELFQEAKEQLEKLKAKKEQETKALLAKQEAEQKALQKQFSEFKASVKETINEGQLGKFKIDDKKEFFNFCAEQMQTDGKGNYYVLQQINSKNMVSELQALYFKHKKGDLSKFVEATAKSTLAQNVKIGLGRTKTSGSNKEDNQGGSKNFFQIMAGED